MRKQRPAWNKGRPLGQKLKPKEIWSLRIRLQLADKVRDLALFNLAVDTKLRGCTKLESTVRYLGIEVDDALEISEQTGIQAATGQQQPSGAIASE